jgi:hypothetical protein
MVVATPNPLTLTSHFLRGFWHWYAQSFLSVLPNLDGCSIAWQRYAADVQWLACALRQCIHPGLSPVQAPGQKKKALLHFAFSLRIFRVFLLLLKSRGVLFSAFFTSLEGACHDHQRLCSGVCDSHPLWPSLLPLAQQLHCPVCHYPHLVIFSSFTPPV